MFRVNIGGGERKVTDTRTHYPCAWVGCLGCYNAGSLVGDWVDGTDAAEYEPHIADPIADPDRPDWRPPCGRELADERWVFDHEDYGGLLDGECSPAEATKVAEAIERIEANGYPVEAVAAFRSHVGPAYFDFDDLSEFEDAFCGEYVSEEEYAEDLADDLGLVNEDASWPYSYIDWERAARDLFMDDYWSSEAPGGGVYVFGT